MKRTIALALSAVMLCGVMMTAGCGKNRPNKNNTGTTSMQTDGGTLMPDGTNGMDGSGEIPENTTSPPNPQKEDPASVKPSGFEDLTFGGRTFTIATADGADPRWKSAKEIYTDGADAIGDPLRLQWRW